MLQIIPAIDVMNSEVVRLERGDPDAATVYGKDPVGWAFRWWEQGPAILHLVDLSAAFGGPPGLLEHVSHMVGMGAKVQVGGGIRSVETARAYLGAGAERVVVGTAAFTEPEIFEQMMVSVGAERVVVGLDVREGQVRIRGWQETVPVTPTDAARQLAGVGVQRLLVTDIDRDGMLSGPNIDLLAEVSAAGGIPVIASGGVSSAADVAALAARAGDGIEGAIIGKALYENRMTLEDALSAAGTP